MYKIVNVNGTNTEILLYSLIQGGYTATRLIEALKGIPPSQPITLRINSDGGEIFDAISIYNYLKERNVSVIIDGICASAATIVAMAGKRITMKTGSLFMIHKPLTIAAGDSEELKAAAQVLDKLTESMITIYQTKTKATHDEILEAMAREEWLSAQEAYDWGFVDKIEEDTPPPQPQTAIRNTATFDDGVRAERQRLQALDELFTPGRARVINRAKYQTGESAQEIALELLKAEAALTPPINGISLPPDHKEVDALNAFSQTINRKRGL